MVMEKGREMAVVWWWWYGSNRSIDFKKVTALNILTQVQSRTRLITPNCISVGSAVFAQLTTESSYTLQYALKRD